MPGWELVGVREVGVVLVALAVVHALQAIRHWFHRDPTTSAHFSPKGGCTEVAVKAITTARREVLVQAYSFSSPDIAKALIAAVARRVRVTVLLDRSNEVETYSELGDLTQHGVEVWIDAAHAIAHNKVIIIDNRKVLTGSFNFTRQAENENAENLLVLTDHPGLAARYRENFQTHRSHCHPPRAGKGPNPPNPHGRSRAHTQRAT